MQIPREERWTSLFVESTIWLSPTEGNGEQDILREDARQERENGHLVSNKIHSLPVRKTEKERRVSLVVHQYDKSLPKEKAKNKPGKI